MTQKKALICGVSGQDGAYLAKLLLNKGYIVCGTSRDSQVSSFRNLLRLGIRDEIKFESVALNDFRSVLQILKKFEPDEVYNLAGQTSVGLSFNQPVETLESIATGCDLLILPTSPKALDLDALMRTAEILDQYEANYKVLLTMVPPRRRRPGGSLPQPHLKERKARELLKQINIPVFRTAIVNYTAFERAPLMGVTVNQYPDEYAQAAWKCYQQVGEEIFNG